MPHGSVLPAADPAYPARSCPASAPRRACTRSTPCPRPTGCSPCARHGGGRPWTARAARRDAWLEEPEANAAHASLTAPWVVPGEHFEVHATVDHEAARWAAWWADRTVADLQRLFGEREAGTPRLWVPLVCTLRLWVPWAYTLHLWVPWVCTLRLWVCNPRP